MPIARFFGRRGEAEFRSLEEAEVGQLLEQAEGGVIALGGGAVCSERIRRALDRHVVVWLQVSASEAWRRVQGSERPLAQDRDRFEALHAEREPSVRGGGGRDPSARRRGARRAGAAGAPRTSRDAAWNADDLGIERVGRIPGVRGGWSPRGAAYWPLEGRRFCVTDATVGGLYAKQVEPLAGRVEVDPGERAKTLAEAERVLRELATLGMTRADHLVALGGGVVGDLGGFCAATYQRGVNVVQVPTTLVAQVDAAYGGKTGVDLPEAKNYVGAYHLPAAVLADTPDARQPSPGGAGGGVRGGREDGADRRWAAVGPGAGPGGARFGRAWRRDLRLRANQAGDRRRGRARRRPARGAQPGAHGGPRDRGGERVSSATATARPLALACWRRFASREPTSSATRCATCWPPTGCPQRFPRRSRSTPCSGRSSATRSAPRMGSASCSSSDPVRPGSASGSTRPRFGRPWRSFRRCRPELHSTAR